MVGILASNGGLTEIDRAIIDVLSRNCRLPATKIGEELDLAPGRVTARIQAMLDRELIKFTAQRNLRAYGYESFAILDITLTGKQSEQAIQEICALPNATIVAECLGAPHLYVFAVARSQEEMVNTVVRDMARIQNIKSCRGHSILRVVRFAGEVGAIEPHTDFWSPGEGEDFDEIIIDKLQADARLSNSEISRQLGVSEASVRQRINKLVADQRVRFGILVEQRSLTVNNIRVDIAVTPAKVRTVAERIAKDAPWVMITDGHFQISAALQGTDLDKIARIIRDDIEQMPGVQEISCQPLLRTMKHNYNCIILP